ncbi:MAG TPA: DUF596 domain-containing protein [Noviherbaspirillum sp.]|nr:DUF596 domain-containing protein [Noviherbaspirillum sp.]
MISEERYKFISDHVRGMALDAVWLYLEDDSQSYQERKESFLWFLTKMINGGLISLAKGGVVIDKSVEDVLTEFKESFPKSDEDINNGIWFFTESCPAGIGWVMPDGSIDLV